MISLLYFVADFGEVSNFLMEDFEALLRETKGNNFMSIV